MTVELDFEPAVHIAMDLFPASVHPENASESPLGEELRVIVTDNYFYVIQQTENVIGFLIREPLKEFDGSNKAGYTVTTERGQEFYFQRALNCGCGTRLRGITVLKGVPPIARNLRK